MNVASEQPERRWIGIAGRSPVHCETFGATVGCDRKCGGVCTGFVVGIAGYVEGLEEGADVPYMHLSCFGPSRDIVWMGDGRQRSRCGEGLGPNAVNAAKMRDRSELEDRIFVQGVRVVLVIGIRII